MNFVIETGGTNVVGIIVAFPKPEDSRAIRSLLSRNGFNVVANCTTGASAINRADDIGEGIIITGYKLPDMLYSDIVDNVGSSFEVILLASKNRLMEDNTGVATLEMPLKVRDLVNSVEMMENQILSKRHKTKRKPGTRSPEDQAIINQAKEALMTVQNLTEEQAHRYLQKNAMDSGCTMVEVAKMVSVMLYRD
ncbi:ANTAR domain-containing protein [uncultured Eubacterium sp.]|uniref:ANTAR domain-containing response regulator n=1 Tax=uncultured Eubacterium sp. TaxID=165185 RepID=UPI003263517D